MPTCGCHRLRCLSALRGLLVSPHMYRMQQVYRRAYLLQGAAHADLHQRQVIRRARRAERAACATSAQRHISASPPHVRCLCCCRGRHCSQAHGAYRSATHAQRSAPQQARSSVRTQPLGPEPRREEEGEGGGACAGVLVRGVAMNWGLARAEYGGRVRYRHGSCVPGQCTERPQQHIQLYMAPQALGRPTPCPT